MATSKPGVLKALINGVYTELKLKSTSDQVYVGENKTLTEKFTEMDSNYKRLIISSEQPSEACLWFATETPRATIIGEQILVFVEADGLFACYIDGTNELTAFATGGDYVISWDNEEYICTPIAMDGQIWAGNLGILGLEDTGEPFILIYSLLDNTFAVGTLDTGESHSIGIYQEKTDMSVVFKEQTIQFTIDNSVAFYSSEEQLFTFVNEKQYSVIWDGVTYNCVAQIIDDSVTLGNTGLIYASGEDTGEPFLFNYGPGMYMITTSNITSTSHTIAIYQ